MAEMLRRDAQPGRVVWIGARPGRREPMAAVEVAEIGEGGLEGDRSRPGKRALTLFQWEHLAVLESLLGGRAATPEALRRNVHVAGLNLSSLRGGRLRLGDALVEIAGPCAPCSRMEEALGPGGFNAMRGHGGWCGEVVEPGRLRLGDEARRAETKSPEDGAGTA